MRLGANTASIFMNLAPVFTAAIAVLFLHEQLHGYHLIGGGTGVCQTRPVALAGARASSTSAA